MTSERKPVAFGDQRAWIKALREQGELHEVTAPVDWNVELGTVTRLAQGTGGAAARCSPARCRATAALP
jgi:4-hydroxy-3-polyprenylbenzoate decarboxylase